MAGELLWKFPYQFSTGGYQITDNTTIAIQVFLLVMEQVVACTGSESVGELGASLMSFAETLGYGIRPPGQNRYTTQPSHLVNEFQVSRKLDY